MVELYTYTLLCVIHFGQLYCQCKTNVIWGYNPILPAIAQDTVHTGISI